MRVKRVSFWVDMPWKTSFYTESRSFDVDEGLTDEEVIAAMRKEAKRVSPHHLHAGLSSIKSVIVSGDGEAARNSVDITCDEDDRVTASVFQTDEKEVQIDIVDADEEYGRSIVLNEKTITEVLRVLAKAVES